MSSRPELNFWSSTCIFWSSLTRGHANFPSLLFYSITAIPSIVRLGVLKKEGPNIPGSAPGHPATPLIYTAQTGLPYFDHAAPIAIGSWYYGTALESMGGHQSFRCRLVNIGLKYKQQASKSCVWAPKDL